MICKIDLPLLKYPLLAALGLLSLHTAGAQPNPGSLEAGWLPGVETGFQEARRTGKPLLVMFRCVP